MDFENKDTYRSAVWSHVESDAGWDGIFPDGFDRECSDWVIEACFEGGIEPKTVAQVIVNDLWSLGASLSPSSEIGSKALRPWVPTKH